MRGLKSLNDYTIEQVDGVAPHMGAWIEICLVNVENYNDEVAPHMGARIEIYRMKSDLCGLLCRTPHGCVD